MRSQVQNLPRPPPRQDGDPVSADEGSNVIWAGINRAHHAGSAVRVTLLRSYGGSGLDFHEASWLWCACHGRTEARKGGRAEAAGGAGLRVRSSLRSRWRVTLAGRKGTNGWVGSSAPVVDGRHPRTRTRRTPTRMRSVFSSDRRRPRRLADDLGTGEAQAARRRRERAPCSVPAVEAAPPSTVPAPTTFSGCGSRRAPRRYRPSTSPDRTGRTGPCRTTRPSP